jgi:succinate dehydrogenase / fumarate reductase cytochrome b subunit
VVEKFKIGGYAVFYMICLLVMSFHLLHGFQSAFQSLGLEHKTYTPLIKAVGIIYTVLVTAGFILIPVYVYFWM